MFSKLTNIAITVGHVRFMLEYYFQFNPCNAKYYWKYVFACMLDEAFFNHFLIVLETRTKLIRLYIIFQE